MRVASLPFVASLSLVAGLAACTSIEKSRLPDDPRQMPYVERQAKPGAAPGYIARLRTIGGSAVAGAVNIVQKDDIMVVNVSLSSLTPSIVHTVVLHENGNCTSPNGFSTGKPWLPPGVRGDPVGMLPSFTANSEGSANMTVRIRGARADSSNGALNRSVLVYEGVDVKPIKAGERNNVVACGVFEAAKPLF